MYDLLNVTQLNQMLPNSIVLPEPNITLTKTEPIQEVLNKLRNLSPYLPPTLKMTWQIHQYELNNKQPVSLRWLLEHQEKIEKAPQKSQATQQQFQRVLGQLKLIEACSPGKAAKPPVGF